MRAAWARLGLRGRLALSIGAIVVAALAVLFVAVRVELDHLASVTRAEESREAEESPSGSAAEVRAALKPVDDSRQDVELAFFIGGGAILLVALGLGYLLAARTAAPLRRLAVTAAAVDAGDLSPRMGAEEAAAVEVRTLAESFDRMLDRLDDAFSRQRRFVADASHELRTPLTAIRGQLEVLARAERVDREEVRRVEGVVLAEMERVERLVEDLLELARFEEGQPLARRRLPVAAFLRGVAEADPAAAASVVEAPAGSFVADPDRLARVLRNLLDNARRHAGAGGAVELGAGPAAAGALRIWVDDDGPGIAAPERELVFDRFYRSQGARDRHSGGSGLGLAIARSVVELHGGRIWAERSPRGGARLALELPGYQAD